MSWVKWTRIKSGSDARRPSGHSFGHSIWHFAIRSIENGVEHVTTYCGREPQLYPKYVPELPEGEKVCKVCKARTDQNHAAVAKLFENIDERKRKREERERRDLGKRFADDE